MRKIYVIIVILLYAYRTFSQSCDFTKDKIITSSLCELETTLNNSDAVLKARDQITFLPGFVVNSANFNGHSFRATIDNSLANQIVGYLSTPISGNSRALDKSGCIPGSIGGIIDVSSNGAATYTIPIMVSPGTHGMEPKLSIAYSSQSGNDILGYGWHLSGFSAITRTNKSQYYDGNFGEIAMNVTDGLALDGARLINTSSNVYSPENDPYTNVLYNGTSFTVTTQDGMVMEYGNSIDSRILTKDGSVPLNWAINKISDSDGNYIEFIYAGEISTGEYRISEINYTGNTNTGLIPYNSVKFYYNKRNDVNTSYISGSEINQSLLLSGIKVFSEGYLSKNYEFSYIYDQYSKLNSISLTADGFQYNPTIINWNQSPEYSNTTILDVGSWLGGSKDTDVYFGDINGDGRSDYIRYNLSSLYVKVAKPEGGFEAVYKLSTSYNKDSFLEKVLDVQLVDWNNDGKDELLINYERAYPFFDREPHYQHIDMYSFDSSGENYTKTTLDFGLYSSANYFYYADINNDGIMDRLRLTGNGPQCSIECENLAVTSFAPADYYKDIKLLDFEGDGQLEVLLINQTGSNYYGSIWKYIENTFVNIYGGSNTFLLGNPNNQYLGDFNGDGKTDILTYKGSITSTIDYSMGTGFIKKELPFSSLQKIAVSDWNNDGKTDIFTIEQDDKIYIYLSNGISFEKMSTQVSANYASSGSKFQIIDLNNDGQKELYYSDNEYYSTYYTYKNISFNNSAINSLYVNSITDGLNNTSIYTYSPYNDNRQFGLNFVKPDFPLLLVRGPMLLVSNLQKTDGSNILSNINYIFQDGYNHMQGKGFLGFKTVTTTDEVSGMSSSTANNFTIPDASGIYCTWPKSDITKKNGITVSTVTNTMSAMGGDINRKFFTPVITSTSVTESLKGVTKITTNSFNTLYGRLTCQTETSGDWIIQTNTNYEIVSDNISRPVKIITTRFNGSDNYMYTIENSYSDDNPLHLSSTCYQSLITYKYNYDNIGNVINKSVVTADGSRRISYTYDSKGRFMIASTDVSGFTSTSTYRSTDGSRLTNTDPNGLTTNYHYDTQDGSYIATTLQPDGNIITVTLGWEELGNGSYYSKKQITNGNTITGHFNSSGQKLSETSLGYQGSEHSTVFSYYPDGSINTSLTNGYETPLSYTYFSDGRIHSSTGPNLDLTYSYIGNSETITNNITGETKTLTYDELGNVITIDGTNGLISYQYFASGKAKQITASGITTSMTYNSLGDQVTLTDPDAGTIQYTYNGFGQLATQTDAKNQTISNTYNSTGQIITKYGPGLDVSYNYYSTPGKLGLLRSVTRNGITETYDYDYLYRTTRISTTGAGKTFITSYEFNTNGKLCKVEYPTGLSVEYVYDNVGNLTRINNASDHSLIWNGDSKNNLDQWTDFSMGNGIKTSYIYDQNNRLNGIQTGMIATPTSIQNLGFTFNDKGQLTTRTEGPLSESFEFNNQNCLTKSTLAGQSPVVYQVDYLNNGNIDNTTIGGQYSYLLNQPHAVASITGLSSTGQSNQIITSSIYTSDNKIAIMDNSLHKNVFSYGPDNNRFKVDYYLGGSLQSSKIYVGNNEFTLNSSGIITYSRTFIYSPTGICAIYERNASDDSALYYIHTDYLGSWLAISDEQGSCTNRYSYDAWGRPRDPSTWQLISISITDALVDLNTMQPRFDRGYTGHEHMAGFGLINMNGRLYDPYLQRFLSPDNYVQDPQNSQSYNRYTYCWNNPLAYIDPSGYTLLSRFGNWVSKGLNNFGKWLNKNHISIQFNYATNSANLSGGTPFVSISGNGYNHLSVGYNINTGNVAFGANGGGFTEFWYPSQDYSAPEQNASYAISQANATYGNKWRIRSYFGSWSYTTYAKPYGGSYIGTDYISDYEVYWFERGNQLKNMLIDNSRVPSGQGGNGWLDAVSVITDGSGLTGTVLDTRLASELTYRKNNLLLYSNDINTGKQTWLNPKYVKGAKWTGLLGGVGDFIGVAGSIYNCVDKGGPESYVDLFFSGVGCFPVAGDIGSLLYTGAKSEMKWKQWYTDHNIDPTFNVYNPSLGF